MKPAFLLLSRIVTALVVAAVLVALFAGSEIVPAIVLYLALAVLCVPAALLLRRRRRRSDMPRMGLSRRD